MILKFIFSNKFTTEKIYFMFNLTICIRHYKY